MNKSFLSDEGIIYVFYEGDQTYETLKLLIDATQEMAIMLAGQSKPIVAVIDHTGIGKLPPPSQWKVMIDALKTSEYDKVAIVVKNKFIRHIAKMVVSGIGKGSRFGFCTTHSDAKQWVLR